MAEDQGGRRFRPNLLRWVHAVIALVFAGLAVAEGRWLWWALAVAYAALAVWAHVQYRRLRRASPE
ncbi:hypothetical protein EDF34_1790 [Cellulomonas sp. PhB150]|nr:hypothetical protein EDF34_1790 [Cellulomonas sp. PhB150]